MTMEELIRIQHDLKAPKNQRNTFAQFNYRSVEDILEAVKPLLSREGCILILSDKVELIGTRYYICATATLRNRDGKMVSVTGWAREQETKKGSDEAQISGAASSYARKYALNGLFCIDDSRDPDTDDTPAVSPDIINAINSCATLESLGALWTQHPEWQRDAGIVGKFTQRKNQFK